MSTQSKQSNPRVWAFWGGVLGLASQVSQLSHMESWGEHAVRNLLELIGMPVIIAFLAFGAARWRNRDTPLFALFMPSNEKKTWQQRVLSTLLGVVLLVALIVFMFFVFSRGQDRALGRALFLATGTAYAFDPPIRDGAPDACAKGNQEACALVTLAVEACAEGNQEACALMKQRKHGRVQKSTLPPECHFIKWRNMTKLYSCNGEIYDADQVRAMRAKTKGRNR